VSELEGESEGIHALINNAGYGLTGPFETTTDAQVREQLETNLFGVFNLTRRVLPRMREHRSGVVVNVGSVGSLIASPLNSLYCATKFGLYGFSLSLAYELMPFGIRVRLIAPGGVATDFAGRSRKRSYVDVDSPYREMVEAVERGFAARRRGYSTAQEIASEIYRSAIDRSTRVLWVAGRNGRRTVALSRLVGSQGLQRAVLRTFGLGAAPPSAATRSD